MQVGREEERASQVAPDGSGALASEVAATRIFILKFLQTRTTRRDARASSAIEPEPRRRSPSARAVDPDAAGKDRETKIASGSGKVWRVS